MEKNINSGDFYFPLEDHLCCLDNQENNFF